MRARLLINLLLLVAVIGLGIFFYTRPEETAQIPQSISPMNTAAVQQIRVERPGKATIKLNKLGGDWKLTAPLEADADDGRVGSMLLLPQSGSDSSFKATNQNLEKFGLEPPQLTLHFDDRKFVIGDENPLNEEQRYVLYNNEVHLINGRLYQRLNAPMTYYVNPDLTPPESRLTRIRLPHGVISRQGEEWRIIPERLSDSPDKVVEDWKKARAIYVKVHKEETSEFAPTVTLEFEEHDAVTYRVIEDSPQVILARPDQSLQYHLHADMAEKLLITEPPPDDGSSAE